MAKGTRASTIKRNNAKLRTKIFGPAVDARTARLSAKLQELAARPRPTEDKSMDIDEANTATEEHTDAAEKAGVDMDVEMKGTSTKHKPSAKRSSSRIEKKSIRKKPRNQVVFPTSAAKKKRIAQSKRKAV